jgi:pimeloyl-[acyl-carrier protein] methyl ester esterase
MILALLPGLDGTGELFAPFVEALGANAVRIIRYPANRAMNYAEHEECARAQLPQNEDFVLLAESFSGPIGISIAAAPPPGLKGLILCVTFASNPHPMYAPLRALMRVLPAPKLPTALAAHWLFPGRGTPELRRAHSDAMRRVSARTIAARVAAILAVDVRGLLARIAVPMLYMRANQDRLIPRAAGLAILNLRPDAQLVKFDAPHFLLQTEPAACAAAVLAFMERCS